MIFQIVSTVIIAVNLKFASDMGFSRSALCSVEIFFIKKTEHFMFHDMLQCICTLIAGSLQY